MIGTATATMPMESDTDTALTEKLQFIGRCVDVDIRRAQAVWLTCFSLTRRFSMKNIMLSLVAGMCLVGFSSLAFAEEMGKMKGEMKGHQD
jgi:hypothetical protein